MHYVIGDVHGCYSALMKLLDKLCLTPEDRVFFVGDFMDRAPSGEEMLKTNQWVCEHITEEGQFQAVIGNHDKDKIDLLEEFYAYDESDAIAEYEELAEMSREPYKLKDYQIFLACNPLKETDAETVSSFAVNSYLRADAGFLHVGKNMIY